MKITASFAGLLSLTSAASIHSRQQTACNNSPDLCSKSYSAITHLGAHDSAFVRDASTGFSISGNQFYNSTVQLSAGVRLLSAQVHRSNNAWHLCHSSCDLLDAGLLSTWLEEIKGWMDANPNDVVTVLLVNSDNAKPADLDQEFQAAEIVPYAYKPPSLTPPTSWPTLQELIDAKTRLMTFVASFNTSDITADTSYLMDEFTFIFETPYENSDYRNFTCEPDRPSALKGQIPAALASNRMPFQNHFLYSVGAFDIETPNVANITITNSPATDAVGKLGQSLQACNTAYSRPPTFVLVDFFDEGPAIDAVDAINGITPVGRAKLPAKSTDVDKSTNSFAGVQQLVEQVADGQKPSLGAWIWASGKWSWGGMNLNGGSILE